MIYIDIISFPNLVTFSIEESDENEFMRSFKDLLKKYSKSSRTNKIELLSKFLKPPIIKIEKTLQNSVSHEIMNKGDYKTFHHFIDRLERGFSKTHKVTDYSRGIGITTRKLSFICRQYSGKSTKELIDERLITESKRQLQFTSYAIKEIALHLGFADQYQFSKFFKKHTKISPVHYRSQSA